MSAAPLTRRQLRALKKATENQNPTPVPEDGTAPISAVYTVPTPTQDAPEQAPALVGRQSTGTAGNYVITDTMTNKALNSAELAQISRRRSQPKRPWRSAAPILAAIITAIALLVGTFILTATEPTQPLAMPSITSGPKDGQVVKAAHATFEFTATEGDSAQCQLDTGDWLPCMSPVTFANLADGVHTLRVRAITGNNKSPAASASWVISTTTTAVTFNSGPAAGAMLWQLPAKFGIAVENPATTTECRIDQGAWVPCAGVYEVNNIAPGRHMVAVRSAQEPENGYDSRSFIVAAPQTKPTDVAAVQLTPEGADAVADGVVDGKNDAVRPQPEPTLADPKPSVRNPLNPVNPGAGADRPTPQPTVEPTTKPTTDPGATQPQPHPTTKPTTKPNPGVAKPRTNAKYGVPTNQQLTRHDGDLTITEAGTVISGLDIHGFVRIKAPNVTLKNSIVRGAKNPTRSIALIQAERPGVRIERVTLSPVQPSVYIDGIKGYGFTANRVEIKNVVDSVLIFGDNSAVLNSYLHSNVHFANDPHQGGGRSHDDGIQVEGGRNIKIAGNIVQGAYNAAIMVTQNRAKTVNLKITNNYLAGGGCTINIDEKGKGPLPGTEISGNSFGSSRERGCAIVAPQTTKIQASNNTYAANGQPAPIRKGR